MPALRSRTVLDGMSPLISFSAGTSSDGRLLFVGERALQVRLEVANREVIARDQVALELGRDRQLRAVGRRDHGHAAAWISK